VIGGIVNWCKIIGHRWDPEAWDRGYPDVCVRCGFCPMYDGELHESRHIRLWRHILWKLELLRPKVRDWLRCPSCGWRFGRHDPNDSHIPF
jgi:hypothetical protein